MATAADQAVLNAIFNPLQPNAGTTYVDDVKAGCFRGPLPSDVEPTDQLAQVIQLEKDGIKLANEGNYDGAIASFSRAIKMKPDWASAYNNRAQAYRLIRKETEAKADLDEAIKLSQGTGLPAACAFVQRGLIHHLNGHNEAAVDDFHAAAREGCPLAKKFLAALNPYSALCNQMLAQMISQLSQQK